MTSSNESAKASRPPATRAVERTGQTMKRNVCQPSAPRSCEASISEGEERRRRATTLLKTMTTQNVAWPTTIVQIENVMCPARNAELSAMAVTMPGSAIGKTSRNEIASRPKKLNRATPNAAIEPSTSAIPVAISPTRTESQSAPRTSAVHAAWNQCVVKPEIGQLSTFDLLNA